MTSVKKSSLSRMAAAAALALACAFSPAAAQKKAKIFGFYPNFDLTPMLTNAQLDLLTHVIYFSIKMPTDGQVTDNYVISQINGQKLVDLIYRAKDRGVGVLLGVGGWELSNEFAGVAGNATLRKTFATTAAKFCKDNGLAGMDIDWEFPTGYQSSLASMLDEMTKTFKAAGLMITLSVNGQAPDYYGSSALNKADYVLIMSYDNGYPHSSYDQATQAVGAYSGQVTNKAKLILGMPFYGKAGGATKTYGELVKQNPGLSASTNEYAGYNFNGPDLIAQKSGYIIQQGGGGTMIWQVSQDAITSGAAGGVLLAAMNKGFASKGATLDKAPVAIAPAARRDVSLSLNRAADRFSLPAARLSQGSYRLTLFTPAGEAFSSATALLPSGGRFLTWPAPAAKSGAAYYRVTGNAHVIASGPVPGN